MLGRRAGPRRAGGAFVRARNIRRASEREQRGAAAMLGPRAPGAGAGRERAAGPAAAAADSRRPAAVGNSSRPAAPRDARSPTVRSPTVYSAAEMTMGHTF